MGSKIFSTGLLIYCRICNLHVEESLQGFCRSCTFTFINTSYKGKVHVTPQMVVFQFPFSIKARVQLYEGGLKNTI